MKFLIPALALLLGGCASSVPRIPEGTPAPDWALLTVDGDTLRSTALRGRTLVLTWIDPTCPEVQDAALDGTLRQVERRWLEKGGVDVFYVASQAGPGGDWLGPGDLKPWMKEAKLRGTVLLDSGQVLAKAWKITRIPVSGVVDASGNVVWAGFSDAVDSLGEPLVSRAVSSALEGAPRWAGPPDDGGGCQLPYR
ncbi:MAG: redoxin family protein [Fibrobacteria bacterium]|nr:redoxin family protein [Fibrobacteria bacterium]